MSTSIRTNANFPWFQDLGPTRILASFLVSPRNTIGSYNFSPCHKYLITLMGQNFGIPKYCLGVSLFTQQFSFCKFSTNGLLFLKKETKYRHLKNVNISGVVEDTIPVKE